MARTFRIPRLKSGGLITTYHCVSRCGHCLYNCGPERSRGYMDRETAVDCFTRIRELGCRSMHIGGGEPVLRPEKLGEVLEAAADAGMDIDYVETNAAWFTEGGGTLESLRTLKSQGLNAFLVSVSPFHNAFIPYGRVIGLMRACHDEGIGVIPWSHIFNPLLSKGDASKAQDWQTLEKAFKGHLASFVLNGYWLHPGGRALNFLRTWGQTDTLDRIFERDLYGCEKVLSDTSHFHVDLHGRYIPGLCSGLSIRLSDLGSTLDRSSYPLIHILMEKGVRGLYDLARIDFGYVPSREMFAGRCDLCNDIRSHLTQNGWNGSDELAPLEYYRDGLLTGQRELR